MYSIGRICVKLAGRDAGRQAIIVDILDDKLVLIDGNVRRRKCNILHLEPTAKAVEIRKNASHEEVMKIFKELGIGVWETKSRKTSQRPIKQRGKKEDVDKPIKESKKKSEKKIVKQAEIIEENQKEIAEKKPIKKKGPKAEEKKQEKAEKRINKKRS